VRSESATDGGPAEPGHVPGEMSRWGASGARRICWSRRRTRPPRWNHVI